MFACAYHDVTSDIVCEHDLFDHWGHIVNYCETSNVIVKQIAVPEVIDIHFSSEEEVISVYSDQICPLSVFTGNLSLGVKLVLFLHYRTKALV